jgi:hypothetical protein
MKDHNGQPIYLLKLILERTTDLEDTARHATSSTIEGLLKKRELQ